VRWGQLVVNVIGGQTVTAPDLLLDQCAGTTTGADGCPVRTVDAATFVADVTVPDSSVWLINQPLVKTWRFLNTGTTVWGDGYALVFVGGDQRGLPLAIPVPTTGPGFQVDLSTTLTTPSDSAGRLLARAATRRLLARSFVELNTAPSWPPAPPLLASRPPPRPPARAGAAATRLAHVTVSWSGGGARALPRGAIPTSRRGVWRTGSWHCALRQLVGQPTTPTPPAAAPPMRPTPSARTPAAAYQHALGIIRPADFAFSTCRRTQRAAPAGD
jgi:hypothetical protein